MAEPTTDEFIQALLGGGLIPGETSQAVGSAYVQAAQGGDSTALNELFANLTASIQGFYNQSLTDDRAAQAFSEEMARQQLQLEREKFEFSKQRDTTDLALEAAGLATGPTGAIQLAYLARGQGAPQEQIRGIFQNLPFLQALMSGQALPGFGVPEQLGGPSDRISTTQGGLFGVNLPGLNSVTERQFSGMSRSEQEFLGALYQAEFGIPIEDALQTIQNSFIPTNNAQPVSISR